MRNSYESYSQTWLCVCVFPAVVVVVVVVVVAVVVFFPKKNKKITYNNNTSKKNIQSFAWSKLAVLPTKRVSGVPAPSGTESNSTWMQLRVHEIWTADP